MDKSQYDICLKVLSILDDYGLLSKIILIGSWCLLLYREFYFRDSDISALRTRDIDFLVPRNTKFNEKADHGIKGLKRYVGLAVLARNIQIIGHILQQKN